MSTTAQAYEERLSKLDLDLGDLQQGLVDAIEHLQRTPAADRSHELRWQDASKRLKELRFGFEPEDYEKEQLVTLNGALLDIRDQLDREGARWNLDVCDELLILLERIRHVVRDALDEHVAGMSGDVGAVMDELDQWLPDTPDQAIAGFIGVDRRTLSRWRHQTGGKPQRNLRVFARLVAILRHNWDQEGIIAWFNRPRRDLRGRAPASLIADPDAEDQLISAARSGRSQYAS